MNQVTPIVVNGVMYLPTGNKVVALDPETGKELWRYDLKPGTVASQRGVAYWPGDKTNSPRILFTSGHKMIGLNALTGKLDPGFGNEGELTMDVPFAGVPTVFKNLIFVGMNIFRTRAHEPNPHNQDEEPGGLPEIPRLRCAHRQEVVGVPRDPPRGGRTERPRLGAGQLERPRRKQHVVLL